jgi:eukaryotic-like serine/threonine-protein kinase
MPVVNTTTSVRAAEIFLALSRVPPDQHAQVLAEQCGGDAEVRAEVARLLAALELPDSFVTTTDGRPALAASEPVSHAGARIGDSPLGDFTLGDFLVTRQIGSGATGVVYLAHQQHPARIVALKVLRREFMASAVQRRFEIEAELLGQMQHPGIAQVYAAHPGDATTAPHIAMELVQGPPLIEFAESHRLSVRDRVELVARVCDAVQHAHQRGIIHRDLKPGNILVTADGQPKVLDFGVARTVGANVLLTTVQTEAGQLLGTLAYMSPEQVAARPDAIDTRTDIHALGVILFRLLARRLPFGHDDPPLPELARRIVSDDAPRLGTIDASLRGDLEVIVARALAKDKDRRYASAAGLGNDLRRYLAGQPISASADSTWYTFRRQIRRYRLALGLTSAVVVALAALAFYANAQRAAAQHQLTLSNLERARLLSMTGNLPVAEELAWRELFRQPESPHAQWTLWEIYSREPSRWTVMPNEAGTRAVRFSPDGRLLLTAGQVDGFVRLIDVDSGRVVRSFAATPGVSIRRAFFTPDGVSVVAASVDGTLRVWDAQSGALRRELPRVVPALVDFALAGGGTQAVTVSRGGVLEVWSLATGRRDADLSDAATGVTVAATDPAGALLLAGARDGVVTAIDIPRRTALWQARAHQNEVVSVAIAPSASNGRIVASGGTDTLVQLRDADTGRLLRTIATENGTARSLAFDRSGTTLAVAGYWRTKLWATSDPSRPPRELGGGEGTTDLDFHPEARFIATSREPDHVRLWDLAADPRNDVWAAHASAVTGLAVRADGTSPSVVSAGFDGDWSIWRSGERTPSLSVKADGRVSQLALTGDTDKRWILTAGRPGTPAVWDARDGRRIAELPDAGSQAQRARAAAFFDGDRRIAVGDSDGVLTTWNWSDGVATHARRIEPPTGTANEILALASHESHLFVAHREMLVVMRDAASARELRRFKSSHTPFSLAVAPDGRLLAVGTWSGLVDVFDVASGQKLHTMKGPTGFITALDFSAHGGLLAFSSRDGSTRVWDVASGQWLATVASRRVGAERVRFFADGRRLAIGYADGEVEIRDLHYFFRYAAGHADHRLRVLTAAGESFPRSDTALAWSRQFLR